MYEEKMDYRWLAGFFDGEGTVHIRPKKKWYSLVVAITQKDRTVLDEIKTFYKFGTIYKLKGKNKNFYFQWKCGNMSAERFLKTVVPYLKIKLQKTKLALEMRDCMLMSAGRKISEWENNRRAKYRQLINTRHGGKQEDRKTT